MKLSVSSYSFQQYIRSGRMTQLDTVKKAAELGFEGIEFTDLKPFEGATLNDQLSYAAEIRREAEAYGIEVVAYAIAANLYQEDATANEITMTRLRGQVDVAAALGAKMLRHDVCYSERYDDRVVSFVKMLPTIAANARALTSYAESKGIRTMTENHGLIVQDSDRVEALYNAVGHPNYGLLIDVGNFACADEDSVKAVSRLAPYAIHAHVKDFHVYPFGYIAEEGKKVFQTRACRVLEGCSVGAGDIPVAQCLAILKRAGYDGWVSMEYEGNEDCVEGITKGLRYLTETRNRYRKS